MSGTMLCHGRHTVSLLFGPKNEQDKKAGIERMRSSANAGLVWSRYLDVWTNGTCPELGDGTERRDTLNRLVHDFNARSRMPESTAVRLLAELHRRQERVLKSAGHAGRVQASLASRLATGLGGPHPTELGFAFERSVGIPYLPGSSVKGLARAAGKLRGDVDLEALFGRERIEREGHAERGHLAFLDAYPRIWPTIELDIIDCHHSEYYTGGVPPLETDDPIPVYFLAVAQGTEWIFRIVGDSAGETEHGIELLHVGLSELGAGAKTAVGYGEFSNAERRAT